jgi:hypothetical protein
MTSTAGLHTTGQDQLSHLGAHRSTECPPARLGWALRAAGTWLGEPIDGGPAGLQRFQADLRLRASDHSSLVTFGKAAYLDIGPIEPLNDGWEAEIEWRASTLAPLFPVFSGVLIARGTELSLSGWYAPPGGAIGRIADHALLHIAAEGTARWFLGALDAAACAGPR